jgi:hypothetical protein
MFHLTFLVSTAATTYDNQIIPAKAGTRNRTGFRVKPGMTPMNMFSCRIS